MQHLHGKAERAVVLSDDQFVRMIRRLARLLLLLKADSSAKPVGAASLTLDFTVWRNRF